MYCLIRWRSQKPLRLGDGKIARAQSLLKTRGGEIEPHHHTLIKERLEYAKDLRQGLEDCPRWVHIEQSRLYCKYAGETLRKVQDMLPPATAHIGPNLSADKLICDRYESAPTHAAFRESRSESLRGLAVARRE